MLYASLLALSVAAPAPPPELPGTWEFSEYRDGDDKPFAWKAELKPDGTWAKSGWPFNKGFYSYHRHAGVLRFFLINEDGAVNSVWTWECRVKDAAVRRGAAEGEGRYFLREGNPWKVSMRRLP